MPIHCECTCTYRKLKQGNKITAGMHKEMVRIEGFYLEAN